MKNITDIVDESTMRRDPKTGRMRKIDPERSRKAKQAARKRGKVRVSQQTRKKISMGLKKARRTGMNRFGKKAFAMNRLLTTTAEGTTTIRNLREYENILDEMRNEIEMHQKDLKTYRKVLSTALVAFNLEHAAPQEEVIQVSPSDTKGFRDAVKLPTKKDQRQLASQFSIVRRLVEKLSTLMAMRAQLEGMWQEENEHMRMLKATDALIKSTKKTLAAAYKVVDSIASQHLPRIAETYVDKLFGEAEEMLKGQFKDSKRRILVRILKPADAPTKVETLEFACYLRLSNMGLKSGMKYPQYFIVATFYATKGGIVDARVTTLPAFGVPGDFEPGDSAKGVDTAIKKLRTMLDAENYIDNVNPGVLPRSKDEIQKFITDQDVAEYVNYVRFSGKDTIHVGIKKMAEADVDNLQNTLLARLRGYLIEGSSSRFTFRRQRRGPGWIITFKLVNRGGVSRISMPSADDIEGVKDMLDLDDAQVQKLLRIIKPR